MFVSITFGDSDPYEFLLDDARKGASSVYIAHARDLVGPDGSPITVDRQRLNVWQAAIA
jgi:hypothetical protein